MKWFESHNTNVFDWPPLSPDFNPIESIWGLMARYIYAGGKQFSNVYELLTAIQRAGTILTKKSLKN